MYKKHECLFCDISSSESRMSDSFWDVFCFKNKSFKLKIVDIIPKTEIDNEKIRLSDIWMS